VTNDLASRRARAEDERQSEVVRFLTARIADALAETCMAFRPDLGGPEHRDERHAFGAATLRLVADAYEAKAYETKVRETSKAEVRGDVSQGPRSPLTAVREARETPARQEAAFGAVGVPGNAGAQAGDPAPGSASPSNVLGESGPGAVPGATRPAAAPADQPAAPGPDELCDIDDIPDCLVGGVHQPHCRHAGKPVTKGGNP